MLFATRTLTVIASLAALTACSLLPAYERPPAPIPAQWPGATPSATQGEPAAPSLALDWQDFFTDPTMRQLIEVALANNRDLRVAVLNIEQARAQLGLRRADQFPALNAAITGARTPTSAGAIASAYSAGLVVTAYELDFFGRVASLQEQALAQYLATREASNTARISLIASVAQTWLSLLADQELLSLSQQTLDTRKDTLTLIELRLRYGAASELDRRLAQSLFENARVTLAQLERQRALDESALSLLLGQALPLAAQRGASATLLRQLRFAEPPVGLPSELLARRADIRQAEQQLIASNANIGAARAAFFPRISLTASSGSASGELAGLFKNGSWGWTLAPQLVLPLFDAGRNQAGLEGAQAGRDIAVAQYEKTIQNAFREVADALVGRDTLARQLDASQALLEAETARQSLTALRYQHGAANQLDWLDAQRSLFASQQALLQTRLAYLQNQIALYKTLGGGVSAAR